MTIIAAADGSALGNPGPAGWAWYIDEDSWRAGGWPHGTNNMGELKAVLDLLEATAVDADQHLHILCDSQYVINSVTKWMPGWKRKGWRKKDGKPVLNVELLKAIDAALAGRSVEFEWVKGHAGHAMNEAADRRANAAATAFQRKQDPQVGPGYRGSGESVAASGPALARSSADAPVSRPVSGPVDTPILRPADAPSARARTDAASPGAVRSSADAPFDRPSDDLLAMLDELAPEDIASSTSAGSGGGSALSSPSSSASSGAGDASGAAFEDVVNRELTLLTDALRADPPSAAQLLHPSFTEVGASGRTYDRDEILGVLAPIPGGVDASDIVADEIAPGVVLLRYTAQDGAGERAERSSIWVRERGQWLLRHHQGTPVTGA